MQNWRSQQKLKMPSDFAAGQGDPSKPHHQTLSLSINRDFILEQRKDKLLIQYNFILLQEHNCILFNPKKSRILKPVPFLKKSKPTVLIGYILLHQYFTISSCQTSAVRVHLWCVMCCLYEIQQAIILHLPICSVTELQGTPLVMLCQKLTQVLFTWIANLVELFI